MKYIVGIDVGGTTVKFGIFPEEGEALYKWEIPTVRGDEEALWRSLADSVKETFKEKGLPYEDLKAAGITLPGPIREDGYLPFCVNLGTGETGGRWLQEAVHGGLWRGGEHSHASVLQEKPKFF